jgi:hypothetical protein
VLLTALPLLAAPLSPQPVDRTGLEIAAVFKSDQYALQEKGCQTADCEAVRVEGTEGVQVDWRPIELIGVFAHVEHVADTTAALQYKGEGVGFGLGAKIGKQIEPQFGVHGWVEMDFRATGSLPDEDSATPRWDDVSNRFQVGLGGAATFGSADDNLIGWIGGSGFFVGVDQTTALSQSYTTELMPFLPVELDGGVMVISEPLGGPWATRGRLAAGISANVGYRGGLAGWISATL